MDKKEKTPNAITNRSLYFIINLLLIFIIIIIVGVILFFVIIRIGHATFT